MYSLTCTLYREIAYSSLETLADVDEELPTEAVLEIEVEYSVHGAYRDATLESPAEGPELELGRVFIVDDDGSEHDVDLTPEEEYQIEEDCLTDIQSFCDEPDPDDYHFDGD